MDMSVNAAKSVRFSRWKRRLARQVLTLALCLAGVIWLKVVLGATLYK